MAAEPRTILNIHGDGETRAAVARLLDAEGLPRRDVASAEEARAALLPPGGGPTPAAGLVLLDASIEGIEPLCRSLRQRAEPVPPLLLSLPAEAEPPADLAALADDTLRRPPDPARWVASIRAWIRVGARLAEQRAEAARWRSSFEALDEGLAMIGTDGAVRWCNAAMAELLGVDRASLLGRSLADLGDRVMPAGRAWPVDRTLGNGGRTRDEWEHGRHWFRSTAAPVRDPRGALAGVVTLLEDVTAEVRLRQRVAQVEAEADSRAEQIEQLERDARLYQTLAGLGPRPGDGGRGPARVSLRQELSEAFYDAVDRYGEVLDLRLRRRGYRLEDGRDGSAELTALADRLAAAGAGPRDVIDLHAMALRARCSGAQAAKERAYAEEGHVAVLELMGRLVENYRGGRAAAVRVGPVPSPDRPSGPQE